MGGGAALPRPTMRSPMMTSRVSLSGASGADYAPFFTPDAVPEPSTGYLLPGGTALFAAVARLKRKAFSAMPWSSSEEKPNLSDAN